MNLKPSTIRTAQSTLADIGRVYHNAIPIDSMFDACKAAGLEPVQEDGTPWSGLLCGREGRATIPFKSTANRVLVLSWYRLETGRYEVTAYIS